MALKEKVIYSPDSPYFSTEINQEYLDIMTYRDIPAYAKDVLHTLTMTHQHRPDLLAFDLYNNSSLWWVFAVRNPDVIKDPINDFIEGTVIRIPRQDDIEAGLGV